MEKGPAIDPYSITNEDRDSIIDKVARKTINYGLETPAIILLEMGKPLSFFGAQGIIMIEPFLAPFLGKSRLNKLSAFFDNRHNIELLIQKLEELSSNESIGQVGRKEPE